MVAKSSPSPDRYETRFTGTANEHFLSRTHSVEDEVAHYHEVNSGLAAEDGEHVGWHALPEVDQEILNLKRKGVINIFYKEGG